MINARMQQALTLALALTGVLWLVACWLLEQPQRAVWALALLVPQALMLGLEILWAAYAASRPGARRALGQAHDMAPEPYPTLWIWARAWLREVAASMLTFGWRQPWAHQRIPDHLPVHAQGRRGVLLVHGFVCNRGFWNPWMERLREADVPFIAVTLEPPFGDVAVQAQGLRLASAQLKAATGVPPLLVGHSMGGLALRRWLVSLTDSAALEHEVITIGSPHHGTALAMMARSQAARQMQLLSPFLTELARRESPERRSRFTCYWSVCDNIVFPANTATLPGARNVAVPGMPHVALAQAPVIIQDVLSRTCAARPSTG